MSFLKVETSEFCIKKCFFTTFVCDRTIRPWLFFKKKSITLIIKLMRISIFFDLEKSYDTLHRLLYQFFHKSRKEYSVFFLCANILATLLFPFSAKPSIMSPWDSHQDYKQAIFWIDKLCSFNYLIKNCTL